jgi:hypothetical protein
MGWLNMLFISGLWMIEHWLWEMSVCAMRTKMEEDNAYPLVQGRYFNWRGGKYSISTTTYIRILSI